RPGGARPPSSVVPYLFLSAPKRSRTLLICAPERFPAEVWRAIPFAREGAAWHPSGMRWASALSGKEQAEGAVADAAAEVRRGLAGAPAHLVVAFVSPHHLDASARLPALVQAALPGALLAGCTGRGIIGAGHEV